MSSSGGLNIYQPLFDQPSDERGFHQQPSQSSLLSDPNTNIINNNNINMHQRQLSTLEYSGNENNRGVMRSGSSYVVAGRDASSTNYAGTSSAREGITSTTGLAGSASFARRDSKLSDSSRNLSDGSGEKIDESIVEEKRKRPNGEGFTIHRYQKGRMIGKGGFAKVYLCTALDTNKQYAVKVVAKSNLVKARARQKLQAEIKIHRMLKHKHICEYKHFFEDKVNCYILLELCHNQSMNEMIKRRKRLTEPEAAYFINQLLDAVKHMHDSNVIHRDLKLGNLFLDKNVHIKVGDLGLATQVASKDEKRKTICGTPNYIAPEVIQGDKSKRGHSFEVDIWSMGVILYTVLIGKPPYEAKDVKATYQRILKNEYSFPSHVPISDCVRDLIQCMLQTNPADRPSLTEIGLHPFLSNPNAIPLELPQTVIHFAPEWRFNEYGELVSNDQKEKSASRLRTGSRLPFGFRDPNSKTTAPPAAEVKKTERPVDMQRIVRTALATSNNAGTNTMTRTIIAPQRVEPTTGFKIFEETPESTYPLEPLPANPLSKPPQPNPSRQVSIVEEALVRRTKALTITDRTDRIDYDNRSARSSELLRSPSIASHGSSLGCADADVLLRMVERLETVLEIAEQRKGMYRSQMPQPVPSHVGPTKWVTRYVDYTSKYGLGFLLNDGTSGVYFNDSTKAALETHNETFQYIERKKVDELDNSARRIELSVETHTLSNFPESLKKKVTLLKHFRNYLLEQQQEDETDLAPSGNNIAVQANLVFVKKWVRTKHAILFRLSNLTVQVIFYDQTEILLTTDDRYITYVNKQHKRATYSLTDDLVGSSAEMEKRLRYAKDIMSQLITTRR